MADATSSQAIVKNVTCVHYTYKPLICVIIHSHVFVLDADARVSLSTALF